MSSSKKKPSQEKEKKQRYNFTLTEITELLIKEKGFAEGKFELTIDFQIGVGSFGPTPKEKYPGAALSIVQIGIAETDNDGPFIIDASSLDYTEK